MGPQVVSMVLRFVLDNGLAVWFFRRIDNQPLPRPWGALLCFLPTFLLYLPATFVSSTLLRYGIRTISVWAYLVAAKRGPRWELLYDALLFCLCLTTCQNFFMTPLLSDIRNVQFAWFDAPWLNLLVARLLEYVITGAVICLCDCFLRIEERRDVEPLRFVICLLCALINISVKHILGLAKGVSLGDNIFPFFICLFTLLLLLLTEYYLTSVRRANRAQMALAVKEYQYQQMATTVILDENTRKLRHDIKNHLVALKALESQPEKLSAYLDALGNELETSFYAVQTGNDLLNALVSQKHQLARERGVRLNCYADFREVNFLDDIDLCTIVGNALDNAIEAAAVVPEAEHRLATFKAVRRENTLLFKVENYYLHEPLRRNGIFVTRKSDAKLHGYGMKNICAAVEKYGGNISVDTSPDKLFRLTVLLPFPEQ